jgi:hypothetical protein
MNRRDVIAGLMVAAAVGGAQAQQAGKVYHIAIVSPATPVAELTETGGFPFWRRSSRSCADWAMSKDRISSSSAFLAGDGESSIPSSPATWFASTRT